MATSNLPSDQINILKEFMDSLPKFERHMMVEVTTYLRDNPGASSLLMEAAHKGHTKPSEAYVYLKTAELAS